MAVDRESLSIPVRHGELAAMVVTPACRVRPRGPAGHPPTRV